MINCTDHGIDINTLKQHLSKEFDLVCFTDLADLRTKHRSVFDLFKECWRAEFQPQQRLVLYSSHCPEQDFINHIQYAAREIDISNFFIMVVCNHDISNLLQEANLKYGYDDQIIINLQLDLASTRPFEPGGWVIHDTLCPKPFMSATLSQNGRVQPCCDYIKSDINSLHGSAREIFYGPEFTAVRQQMKAGQKPAQCQRCYNSEKLGSISLRQLTMIKYRRELDERCLDAPTLTNIDVSPSSLCNFTCRICDSFKSTSIRNEEIQFAQNDSEKKRIKKLIPIFELGQQYVDEIVDNLELTNLHVMGGEPFLWPKLPGLIDKLVDTGRSKQLRLEFNSNGSTFPTYLADQINEFQHIEILLSIDAVGERFEIERGGVWWEILDNLSKYQTLNRKSNVVIKLAPTINIQNLLYLDDIVSLAQELGFDLVWWYVKEPNFLCIDNVTSAVKQAVVTLYHDHPVPELAQLSKRMSLTPPVSGEPFLAYMAKLDHRRDQVFSQSHQKICELMQIQL